MTKLMTLGDDSSAIVVAIIISFFLFEWIFVRNKNAVLDFYLFVYEKKSFIDVIYAKGTKDVLAILISKSDILDLWRCPYVGPRLILSASTHRGNKKLKEERWKTFFLFSS